MGSGNMSLDKTKHVNIPEIYFLFFQYKINLFLHSGITNNKLYRII
jgi:hypothetical protein